MVSYREGFTKRLNEALDASPIAIPPKGEGRQQFVGKLFKVSQKGARKWLEGEGFPSMEKCLEIANRLNVAVEWLLTGRGAKRVIEENNAQIAQIIDLWFKMKPEFQIQWLRYGEFLLSSKESAGKAENIVLPGYKDNLN